MSINLTWLRPRIAQARADFDLLEALHPAGTPEGDAIRRLHKIATWGRYRLRALGDDPMSNEPESGGHDDKPDPEEPPPEGP